MPPRYLTTSGIALQTHHQPEMQTYFNTAQHADGSVIALSHSYPEVTVIMADIVGTYILVAVREILTRLNRIYRTVRHHLSSRPRSALKHNFLHF